MSIKALLFTTCTVFLLSSCDIDDRETPLPPDQKRISEFSNQPVNYPLPLEFVKEASGLIPSRTINGYLWVHEDSGTPANLYLLSYDAQQLHTVPLTGASNIDWEDIASGPGPLESVNYLYIGDIGNNHGQSDRHLDIYRIPETKSIGESFSSDNLEKITFRYPDGNKDAETLLVDPLTRDLLIVTKELTTTRIYKLPYPQATNTVLQAELVGTIPNIVAATGGDISFDGEEIVIRNYGGIFYWYRKPAESISETLLRAPDKSLPYRLEQQGEAICFDTHAKGYYTISERTSEQPVSLLYYPRRGN